MRPAGEFDDVNGLIAAGLNDCEVSRRTGVPRKTVWEWRHGTRQKRQPTDSVCADEHSFAALPAAPYAYLLGMYLGDGCISRHLRTCHLRITCDTNYPAIMTRCTEAIDALMPNQQAAIAKRPGRCADVSHYSKHWPCLFPQHGPGRKHHRKIALEPWQEALVYDAAEEFVLGLIHSDGCRVVANDRGVLRYH
jgi:hypothetical protein